MTVLSKRTITSLMKNGKLLTNLICPDLQIQPNGIDLTLEKIEAMYSRGGIDLDNTRRKLPEVGPIDWSVDDMPHALLLSGCYKITFNEIFNMPNNVIAMIRPRSSLIRMGASIHAGVVDAGFKGKIEALLVVYNPYNMVMYKNARLAQVVFYMLDEKTTGYSGIYNKPELLIKND